MEVELHRSSIDSLVDEWGELFRADPAATPFTSPEWAQAWWPHWAKGAEPWLITVRDSGRLVGLATLVLRRRGPFRILGELGRHPSNYWDILARNEVRGAVSAAVAAELARRTGEWDGLVLGCLPATSPTESALSGAGLRTHRRAPIAYPGIELPATFDGYLATLPAKRRKDVRRHLRRLDEGDLECHVITDAERLPETVTLWQRMRLRWWRERGKAINPEHGSDRFREFMADLVSRLVPRDLASVWEFRVGGKVVGVEISLTDRRRFYAWLDGYDPDHAQLGLGKVAVANGIRSSIEAGRAYYDFMVGAEAYKYWYGATDRYCHWLICTSQRWRSRALNAANAAREMLPGQRSAGGGGLS